MATYNQNPINITDKYQWSKQKAKHYFNLQYPSLVLQKQDIETKFPVFDCKVKNSTLICEGYIKPTHLSNTYKIRIEYLWFTHPNVFVLEPKIKTENHVYGADPYPLLCLYYPKSKEWKPTYLLTETIIAWTYTWLETYELCEITGEWYYDEAPHPIKGRDKRKRMKGIEAV